MSFLKRAAAIVLCLCMAAFCSACDEGDEESAPVENVSAVTKDEYVKAVKDCLEKGKRCEKQFLDETAAYFYGFALSSAGSMRFAAEKILWLKGEGNDFSEVTSGSRYTDWDTLAAICYACPFPYYFEGLLCDIQGEGDRAAELYSYASVMDNFPEKGLNFYYMRNLSVEELYALRDELRALEEEVCKEYIPEFTGFERTVYNFSAEYMRACALDLLEREKYDEAMIPVRYAVQFGHLDVSNWVTAVTAALGAEDFYRAASWLSEGLSYFPENESLLGFKSAMLEVAEEE